MTAVMLRVMFVSTKIKKNDNLVTPFKSPSQIKVQFSNASNNDKSYES